MRLLAVEELARTVGSRISSANSRKSRHIQKNDAHRHLAKVATRQRFCHNVFTRPRPAADIDAPTPNFLELRRASHLTGEPSARFR